MFQAFPKAGSGPRLPQEQAITCCCPHAATHTQALYQLCGFFSVCSLSAEGVLLLGQPWCMYRGNFPLLWSRELQSFRVGNEGDVPWKRSSQQR